MKKIPVEIIGSGGAFDVAEGNSSFIFTVYNYKFLVDCGSTVYSRVKMRSLLGDISAVCITHMHDDHIGSLSALIYDRYYLLRMPTVIITSSAVEPALREYLKLTGHAEGQFFIVNEMPNVKVFNTSGLHKIDMKSCGFIFESKDMNIIYSGDLGCPVSEIPVGIDWGKYTPQNTVIFHDASTYEIPPHCHFTKLEELAKFYQVYCYHHCQREEDEILNASDKLDTVALY